MLETLRIQNVALIDEIEVDFRPGFNVLTGETGAGKSILIGALNLVLGARASSDVLRAGTERARIEAVFRLPKPSRRLLKLLETHGAAIEEERLLLARTIASSGGSRAYAGGALVSIAALAEIGDELVDMHGQHDHQSLFKTERQLGLLDNYCRLDALCERVSEQVSELRQIANEIEALSRDDRDRVRRLEFLRFEVQEIKAAALNPGEEEEIRSRLNLINNAETVFRLATQIHGRLFEAEEVSAVDVLGAAQHDLDELAAIDDRFQALCEQLAEARNGIESVASEIRGYADRLEFDPGEQEELNRRIALIGGLKRKYGNSVDEILTYHENAEKEMSALENHDTCLEELRRRHDTLRHAALKDAAELSAKRAAGAKKLDKQVSAVLRDLGMKEASFETRIETVDLSSRGCDRVEFMLAANAGEPLKPLRQVASGGEISRVMLSIKATLAEADEIPALIFDEIDAGVGGNVALKVGEKLTELARSHQVLCITHLAQIAVQAPAHYTVAKENDNGRTRTRVHLAEGQTRIEELARLLDGTLSKSSLEHARDLLGHYCEPSPGTSASRGSRQTVDKAPNSPMRKGHP